MIIEVKEPNSILCLIKLINFHNNLQVSINQDRKCNRNK